MLDTTNVREEVLRKQSETNEQVMGSLKKRIS